MAPKPKKRKRTKKDERDELLARLVAAAEGAVAGEPAEWDDGGAGRYRGRLLDGDGPTGGCRLQQTKTGTRKAVWVSFYTGAGRIAALEYGPDATAAQVGGGMAWALTSGFTMPFKDVTQAALPADLREVATLHNPDDAEVHSGSVDLAKEFRKPNMKEAHLHVTRDRSFGVIKVWSAKTNDALAVQPEKEACVALEKPLAPENAGTLGEALLQRCQLGLSREEAHIHPGEEYKASRPKWADV